jgi:hypothetical protein
MLHAPVMTMSDHLISAHKTDCTGPVKGSGIARTGGKILRREPVNDTVSYWTAARTPNLA